MATAAASSENVAEQMSDGPQRSQGPLQGMDGEEQEGRKAAGRRTIKEIKKCRRWRDLTWKEDKEIEKCRRWRDLTRRQERE
eukprot:4120145-Amphidinium_carterae.1